MAFFEGIDDFNSVGIFIAAFIACIFACLWSQVMYSSYLYAQSTYGAFTDSERASAPQQEENKTDLEINLAQFRAQN